MQTSSLHAPWRMEYIRSLEQNQTTDPDRCFLCQASQAETPEQQRQRMVLWRTPQTVVLMNRFPYANGHLLIAPRAHTPELDLLDDTELLDLQKQTALAVRLLRRAVSAQGFNIGINLGHCAGAGLPGHLHQHVVPRWSGDTNFMSVVGETRIIPQAMQQLYDELLLTLRKLAEGDPAGHVHRP